MSLGYLSLVVTCALLGSATGRPRRHSKRILSSDGNSIFHFMTISFIRSFIYPIRLNFLNLKIPVILNQSSLYAAVPEISLKQRAFSFFAPIFTKISFPSESETRKFDRPWPPYIVRPPQDETQPEDAVKPLDSKISGGKVKIETHPKLETHPSDIAGL